MAFIYIAGLTGAETLIVRCYILQSGGLDALCASPLPLFSQKCETKLQWLRILSVILKIRTILPDIQNISSGGGGGGGVGGRCGGGGCCVCCYGCCGVGGGGNLSCKRLNLA